MWGNIKSIWTTIDHFTFFNLMHISELPIYKVGWSYLWFRFFSFTMDTRWMQLKGRWIGMWMKSGLVGHNKLGFAWSHSSLQEVFWNLVKPEPGERRDQFLIAKSDAMVFDIIRYNWSCGTWEINCCQGIIWRPSMYTLFFSYYAIRCS